MRKIFALLISLLLCTLSQRYLLRLSPFFFPDNMEGSKRTTIGHLCSSTKNKQTNKTKQKRYNVMVESLLSNSTSNCFKFIITPIPGKYLWPPSQKWNDDSYLQENQGLQTTCSCNLCHVSLKTEQFNGDSNGAKGVTSGVNIYYLRHLIKPQTVY